MLIPEDSPLRLLPMDLSRRQILYFDGIRYAAEMINLSYNRLFAQLMEIGATDRDVTTLDIATAMLDAWSIVDSTNRFRDLVKQTPGLRNEPWQRILLANTSEVDDMRNGIQHIEGNIGDLAANSRQVWGYLRWAQMNAGSHTGWWYVMTPGSVFRDDKFMVAGPVNLPRGVPPGAIRLMAFGKDVYLGKCMTAVATAVEAIVEEIKNGEVRLIGDSAHNERTGGDTIYGMAIEVATKVVIESSPPNISEIKVETG